MYKGAHLRSKKESETLEYDDWWHWGEKKAVLIWVSMGRYWLVLAWYKVVLGYYRAFMPVYIEKVEIWSDVIVVGRTTDKKGKMELLSRWNMDGWDEQKHLSNWRFKGHTHSDLYLQFHRHRTQAIQGLRLALNFDCSGYFILRTGTKWDNYQANITDN